MIYRQTVEEMSRAKAGIKAVEGNYQLVTVLGAIEMYVLDSDKSVSPHLANDGFWESWITTWFINNIRPGTVFFDIGANTGYYAFLAQSLGALVEAFEPNPVYAEMIRQSAKHLELDRGFHVSEYALSDYNGEAVLHVPTELHGSGSLNEIPPGYEFTNVTVNVRSFDELKPRCGAGVQVFKIDAEGEEERVLAGMKKFLAQTPHKVIMMEYTPGAYSPEFVANLFNDWQVRWINHSGNEDEVSPEWLAAQSDWVMLVLR